MKIKKLNLNKVKKVKPGELRITAVDNRFLGDPPYLNTKTKLPQWFRSIHKGDGSIRSCAGVMDFLELGVTVPSWTTFTVKPNRDAGRWEVFADPFNPGIDYIPAGYFQYSQTGKCPMTDARKLENMTYPKLHTPWRMQTAPGWSTLILPAYYEENPHFSILPAVVHTDFYQIMNIVLNVKSDSEFVIRQGTPLVQLIPFQRKNSLRHLEFIDESFFKYASSNMYMTGGTVPANGGTGIAYRKAVKVVDNNLESQKKKFWFGRKAQ